MSGLFLCFGIGWPSSPFAIAASGRHCKASGRGFLEARDLRPRVPAARQAQRGGSKASLAATIHQSTTNEPEAPPSCPATE